MIPEHNKIYEIDNKNVNNTYYIDFNNNSINGMINDEDALKQTIYNILMTERYTKEIYSTDYGIELDELIGKKLDYIKSEIKRMIIDSLSIDERIKSIDNFKFTVEKNILIVDFEVNSIYGNENYRKEVQLWY